MRVCVFIFIQTSHNCSFLFLLIIFISLFDNILYYVSILLAAILSSSGFFFLAPFPHFLWTEMFSFFNFLTVMYKQMTIANGLTESLEDVCVCVCVVHYTYKLRDKQIDAVLVPSRYTTINNTKHIRHIFYLFSI